MIKRGLPAILDENTEIFILESLPSDESIRKQQYYRNPGNDFWRLVGSAIRENLQDMAYERRLETLKLNRIGLWDVFNAGNREGSLDSRIGNEEINDFSSLKEMVPELKLVCFNGKKAGEYEPLLRGMGY